MEKLQGPINPCLVGEDLDVGWLEEIVSNTRSNYKFEDAYREDGYDSIPILHYSVPSLDDKTPFLQMLQGVEPEPPNVPLFMQEQNYFQFLLSLQHQKMILDNFGCDFTNTGELASNNMIKSEVFRDEHSQILPQQQQQCDKYDENKRKCDGYKQSQVVKASPKGVGGPTTGATKERRKRKRPTKATKNKEEVETQRMTHIAVERNRRRQMNDHLNALKSLMPPSYVQRGDQASIIGGAIDFVKEMEQLLQSLQVEKRMRHESNENIDMSTTTATTSSSALIDNMFMTSPTSTLQFRNFSPNEETNNNTTNGNYTEVIKRNNNNINNNEEFSAENRSALADIKVVVIQNHVNLKIQCQRRPGQLLKAILAFEELRLTILHLNITSLHNIVHYSFNLKIEEGCKLGTADEVVRAVHHIFSLINLS